MGIFSSQKAPQVGLEPTTYRLTADRSAIELLRKDKRVDYIHCVNLCQGAQSESWCSVNTDSTSCNDGRRNTLNFVKGKHKIQE